MTLFYRFELHAGICLPVDSVLTVEERTKQATKRRRQKWHDNTPLSVVRVALASTDTRAVWIRSDIGCGGPSISRGRWRSIWSWWQYPSPVPSADPAGPSARDRTRSVSVAASQRYASVRDLGRQDWIRGHTRKTVQRSIDKLLITAARNHQDRRPKTLAVYLSIAWVPWRITSKRVIIRKLRLGYVIGVSWTAKQNNVIIRTLTCSSQKHNKQLQMDSTPALQQQQILMSVRIRPTNRLNYMSCTDWQAEETSNIFVSADDNLSGRKWITRLPRESQQSTNNSQIRMLYACWSSLTLGLENYCTNCSPCISWPSL